MKVALLHNPRPADGDPGLPEDAFEEFDSADTIESIAGALESLGVEVEPVVADGRLPWRLDEGRFDFAFNIAEGQGGRCREAIPAAVCELLGLPVTGSDAMTLALTLDKWTARRVVSPEVPVAPAVLIESLRDEQELESFRFPAMVKPNDEGSSKGIRRNPVAQDFTEARERCAWLRETYGCPILVEEFLPGAEVTVGVAGNANTKTNTIRVLGMMEIAPVSHESQFVYSLEVKREFQRRVRYHIPPRLPCSVLDRIQESALLAYRLLGCRDIARFDFRLDSGKTPCFLECNPLPGLNPESGDIVILSRSRLSYEKLVQGILLDAAGRVGIRIP
jgi:D-alanine-D-alanine ligase